MLPPKVKDIEGQRFGRLLALDFVELRPRGKLRYAMWRCECTCGREVVVSGADLRQGNTKSCGCLVFEVSAAINRSHGQASVANPTGAYRSWKSMMGRCCVPSNISYPDYGGRGIKVCDRWRDFAAFYEDMGPRPAGYSIERDCADGNYEPGNCRWIPCGQQARNTRRTVWVVLAGERMSLGEAAEKLGRHRGTVWTWLRKTRVPPGIDISLAATQ